ncbi:MAG: phosphoenolpyruvate--protein phosphotransferase [Opitutaceae bacterium]
MPDADNQEIVLTGIPASPGVAHGTALIYSQNQLDVPEFDIEEDAIDSEIDRLDHAIIETRAEITAVRNKVAESLGDGEAAIFDAHLMVLEDSALISEATAEVRTLKKNVEFCYNNVAQRYISFFSSMEDEYLKERVSDIRDVTRRLLHNLVGTQKVNLGDIPSDSIVISEDISPSDTADMDRTKLLGFVTDAGGKTSHSVIMARSLRIPAVVGTHDATKHIKTGDSILLDGHEGIIVINPTEDRLYKYGKLVSERRKLDAIYETAIPEPSETKDGVAIELMANVEGAQEMEQVLAMNADGVGLFRTEGIFLRHHGFPSEAVQYEEYDAVAKAAGKDSVIIRTLDVGGDKIIGVDSMKEDNSFMGFRAIRFCLENLSVFKTQLRAILRASANGNVKLMYPMISGIGELHRANEVLDSVKAELRAEGQAFDENMPVGAMVEVPSAAVIVDLLAAETDFLSIGTNDLIQYLMAVDRLNDRVAHLYEPTHPAVIRTLKKIIDGGRQANVHVSVCGEIAGDPIYAPLLVGMGASSLSLTSSSFPEVKYLLRQVDSKEAEALVEQVLATNSSSQALALLEAFRKNALGDLTA